MWLKEMSRHILLGGRQKCRRALENGEGVGQTFVAEDYDESFWKGVSAALGGGDSICKALRGDGISDENLVNVSKCQYLCGVLCGTAFQLPPCMRTVAFSRIHECLQSNLISREGGSSSSGFPSMIPWLLILKHHRKRPPCS